mmetsp:Transcript_65341/g.181249  ORF Transcript_65341/g.181249 Transcript_65341/m.181249 type:complete len:583 (-) Transcript_65341:88-1836(-)|eukprot:CAMPEP_0179112256 /NCGR_PEP_ID=MMETSP0796-20121207/52466_1 /TAXON_ID=73915 /ORGANISM="Pyrodinium bahamense, Strain pbaha01" /LENGTH=582 /DNA_ID=CAMNT_0020810421 /DNA_START=42 /DNA_END=1790 /DNA_ORIENTATION=+
MVRSTDWAQAWAADSHGALRGYHGITRRTSSQGDSEETWASAKRHCQSLTTRSWEGCGGLEGQEQEAPYWHGNNGYTEHAQQQVCQYFQKGFCTFGDKCWYLHPQRWENGHKEPAFADLSQPDGPAWELAGIRFVVTGPATERSPYCKCTPPLDTGPMRLRVAGSNEALGGWEDEWDPQAGVDLHWEGDRWTSVVLTVPPRVAFTFCLARMDEPECHPGVLQGCRRAEAHESRVFTWGPQHAVSAPPRGQVLEVHLQTAELSQQHPPAPALRSIPRASVTAFAGGLPLSPSPPAGRQRCYTFDAPGGVVLHFCMYLPPGYDDRASVAEAQGGCGNGTSGWPVLLFLHSMHGRLDGDNNLFFESDTPLHLLLGHPACPAALRERFIVVSPQCPVDPERPDGCGIWLRNGWYEDSTYAAEMELALAALLEAVAGACNVDRQRICVTGTSMGAYASLELAARWPGFFSAVAPVAAHYDLDPVDDLVTHLTQPQELPLWFFHAENDGMCPYEPIESLVQKLRTSSRAEVRLTSFEDTWSNQGHCADRVPYWAIPRSPGQEALGEELFSWLSLQRGPGRSLRAKLPP